MLQPTTPPPMIRTSTARRIGVSRVAPGGGTCQGRRRPEGGGVACYTAVAVTPAAPGPDRWSVRRTFAALRYRNYRLWFACHAVSLVGTRMQSMAQGFLVFELTLSPVYLGYVGFAAGIPSWLFLLYGAVMADRIPKRALLL